jgi:transmembrane sensor
MTDTQTFKWLDPERDPTHVAAADWVARLSNSNVSLEDTLAWQSWMSADVSHAEVFHRFEQISRSLKTMAPPPPPRKWQLARDAYDGSMPLSDWNGSPERSSRILAAAAAVILGVGATAWAMMNWGWQPWESSEPALVTQVGENRSVNLSDGSIVILGGATRLKWSFTEENRSLELLQGEALFKVAKDPARPFKVSAGDAMVVALGTEFNVRRVSDHTVVAVTDGLVVVEPVTHILPITLLREFKPKLRPVHVHAGEQTTSGSAGIESASRIEDLPAATSWKTGRLAFRLQPLKYVLEDVNRYAKKPVAADNESVGSLIVSGTVMGDNVEGWVESLEHAFGLTAVEEDGRIVLKARH